MGSFPRSIRERNRCQGRRIRPPLTVGASPFQSVVERTRARIKQVGALLKPQVILICGHMGSGTASRPLNSQAMDGADDFESVRRDPDPVRRGRRATDLLTIYQQRAAELARLRRAAIEEAHREQGMSYTEIAAALGSRREGSRRSATPRPVQNGRCSVLGR